MPSIDRFRDLGEGFISKDRMEGYVRYCLVQNPGIFRNHFSGQLPRMLATIPGQHNEQHGVDVFALDGWCRLWLIEISRGRAMGAGSEKRLPKRRYAGNKAQMSPEWRRAAADRFLRREDSTKKLQALFDVPGLDRQNLEQLFEDHFKTHKAAVLVPAGCHVAWEESELEARTKTDEESKAELGFATDIYTFRWLPADSRTR